MLEDFPILRLATWASRPKVLSSFLKLAAKGSIARVPEVETTDRLIALPSLKSIELVRTVMLADDEVTGEPATDEDPR